MGVAQNQRARATYALVFGSIWQGCRFGYMFLSHSHIIRPVGQDRSKGHSALEPKSGSPRPISRVGDPVGCFVPNMFLNRGTPFLSIRPIRRMIQLLAMLVLSSPCMNHASFSLSCEHVTCCSGATPECVPFRSQWDGFVSPKG